MFEDLYSPLNSISSGDPMCAIPRGNGYVEVEVRPPTQKEMASMDAVGALVLKANTRL